MRWGTFRFNLSSRLVRVVKAEIFPFCFFLATSPSLPLCVASSRYRPSVIIQGKTSSLFFSFSSSSSWRLLSRIAAMAPMRPSLPPHWTWSPFRIDFMTHIVARQEEKCGKIFYSHSTSAKESPGPKRLKEHSRTMQCFCCIISFHHNAETFTKFIQQLEIPNIYIETLKRTFKGFVVTNHSSSCHCCHWFLVNMSEREKWIWPHFGLLRNQNPGQI